MRVALFVPCFINQLFPDVGRATLAVLENAGCEVYVPLGQTCCGQPPFNSGLVDEARRAADHFAAQFQGVDAIVTPSGSCAAMVRCHYPSLPGQTPLSVPPTYELCQFLVDVLNRLDHGATLVGRGLIHVGCHQRNELHSGDAPFALLRRVSGLELVPSLSDEWCCGFGGTFSVNYPRLSVAMGSRKLAAYEPLDYNFLITTDSSCGMQLQGLAERRNQGLRVLHVAEVLAGAHS
ncbi:MAG: (Fe-S)-binding protein [Myxococcales bacterium]|nr:(Fe-S)-binding protein [Myxococcales bacterium]